MAGADGADTGVLSVFDPLSRRHTAFAGLAGFWAATAAPMLGADMAAAPARAALTVGLLTILMLGALSLLALAFQSLARRRPSGLSAACWPVYPAVALLYGGSLIPVLVTADTPWVFALAGLLTCAASVSVALLLVPRRSQEAAANAR